MPKLSPAQLPNFFKIGALGAVEDIRSQPAERWTFPMVAPTFQHSVLMLCILPIPLYKISEDRTSGISALMTTAKMLFI